MKTPNLVFVFLIAFYLNNFATCFNVSFANQGIISGMGKI